MEVQATGNEPDDEAVEDLELDEGTADEVVGGKASVSDLTITKQIDKSSPTLFS